MAHLRDFEYLFHLYSIQLVRRAYYCIVIICTCQRSPRSRSASSTCISASLCITLVVLYSKFWLQEEYLVFTFMFTTQIVPWQSFGTWCYFSDWILLILLSMHSSVGSLVLVNIIHWTQSQWFTTLKPLLALGPVLPVVRVAIMTNITAERVCQSNGMWSGSPTVCSNPLFLEISEICVQVHLANQNHASVLNVSQDITKISTTACKTS